jgi:hypothetical protein
MSKEIKNLKVIGFAGQGKTALMQQAIEDSINRGERVIIVDTSNEKVTEYPINSFTVNGERYVPIEKETSRSNYRKSKLAQVAEMLATPYLPYIDNFGYTSKIDRKLSSNIDIIKEYGLIQLKKSTLSSWERNAVVRMFERNYKKVE